MKRRRFILFFLNFQHNPTKSHANPIYFTFSFNGVFLVRPKMVGQIFNFSLVSSVWNHLMPWVQLSFPPVGSFNVLGQIILHIFYIKLAGPLVASFIYLCVYIYFFFVGICLLWGPQFTFPNNLVALVHLPFSSFIRILCILQLVIEFNLILFFLIEN